MFSLTLLNSLMLCFLVMILCSLTTTAPTHHLTIGVQGNTPTLMVTSSEIGITSGVTVATNKKSLKSDIITIPLKDLKSNEKHKILKMKLNKNPSLLTKKEKLQFMKESAQNQRNDSKDNKKSTSSEVKIEEYKKTSALLAKDLITLHSQEVDDVTTDTMLLPAKPENNTKLPGELNTQQSKKINNFTIFSTTPTSFEVGTDKENNFDVNNLDPRKIPDISTPPTLQPLKNDKNVKTILLKTSSLPKEPQYTTTIGSPLSSKKTIEFSLLPATEDISIVATNTPLPPTKLNQSKNLTTTLELSTSSGMKDITDIFTTIINNNNDTFNTATTSKALKYSSTTATILTNDDIVATSATAKQITDKETTTIKSENDNDRNTESTIILRNENLLLTSTPTRTMTTTIPTIHVPALTTNNAIAETATMTTTIDIDGDDEEQQALTETSETALNRNKAVDDDVVLAKTVTDNKSHRRRSTSSHSNNNNNSVYFKSRHLYKAAILTTTPAVNIATFYTHTHHDDETITTENPLTTTITQEIQTNEQSVIEIKTEIETTATATTTVSTPLIKKEPEQQKTIMKSKDFLQKIQKFSDYDDIPATTTEKELKLIDLEKHDNVKQSSLSSIQQHHDNGHDGLKNIKKKQLIDKHYIEALLPNKQDITDNNSNQPATQKSAADTSTPSSVTSSISHSAYTATAATTPFTKPLLLPIKHGYLGPILMEEKTFHIIHHPTSNTNNFQANKVTHLSSLETQLRKGHFVELKAKAEIEPTTNINNIMKYEEEITTVANKIEAKETKTQEKLQIIATHLDNTGKSFTNNKDKLTGNTNNKSGTDFLEYGNEFQISAPVFGATVTSTKIHKEGLSKNQNNKVLSDSIKFVNDKVLVKSAADLDNTFKSKIANKENIPINRNYKSSEDSLESRNLKGLQDVATDLNTAENLTTTNKENILSYNISKPSKDSMESVKENNFQTSTLKSTTINEDQLSGNLNYISSTDSLDYGNKQNLQIYATILDPTVETTTISKEVVSNNENYKSSEDFLESDAQKVILKSAVHKDSCLKSLVPKKDPSQGPHIDLQKYTTVLPHTENSTVLNTGEISSTTYANDSPKDSLEFGTHNILLKSEDIMDSTVNTNKDKYLPQPQIEIVNQKNSAKVLTDTVKVSNKFYAGNINKSTFKKSDATNKTDFLTDRGLFKDFLDLKSQSLHNSAKVLSDTVPASREFYTKNEDNKEDLLKPISLDLTNEHNLQNSATELVSSVESTKALTLNALPINNKTSLSTSLEFLPNKDLQKSPIVLSTTVFQIVDTVATKTPIVPANTMFTNGFRPQTNAVKEKTESKISDIQIEVYDSTVDSIVASTNFKDNNNNPNYSEVINEEAVKGKTTKPPVSSVQQERFTQYVIDRTETSTQEPINFSTIQVASGKPEPAAIEIHINVSESFGNESEDLEFSYPQAEYINNNNNNERVGEESYDDTKVNNNIKLIVPSNSESNSLNKDPRSDEILVVEVIDTDNTTDQIQPRSKSKNTDDLFISENTPPPPPPPPPYQPNFDRDSDTIFYISNTEVKVGESIPNAKTSYEERKLKLESQFFPANYMASTHPNANTGEDSNSPHHLYEEDIILSSNNNQADSLKIYRNRNEPSPPLDVTYVGESIIEVEQSPDSAITTTYAPDQHPHVATQQADVIIQPAILPEISIGVPVIGELPPQIELKEIDFMPNEAQLHRSGIYEENDDSNNNINNMFNNDIDDNTMNAGSSTGYNSHDVDNINNNKNNQRLDDSSIQYGGDLIDESADGGFDGVEGSYPFGNPNSAAAAAAAAAASISAGMTKTRKQQKNHIADYTHLYVNYGVNNMRKDELSADVKDSGELVAVGGRAGDGGGTGGSNEQNITSLKEFLNKVSINNSSYLNGNLNQTERMSNATAFSVLEDVNDLKDINTENMVNFISLTVGLLIVILPVVVTCSMFWTLRYLYKKYHSTVTDSSGSSDQTDTKGQMNEDGVEKGEFIHEPPPASSSPTNSDKDAIQKFTDTSNKPSTTDSIVKFSTEKSSQLDQNSTKDCSSQSSTSKTKDSLQLLLALPSFPLATDMQTVHDDIDMPGPNGSITKMTLENNLLIVETEERNDISRVARETKMDYNKDGVFVVEVSRGIDSKTIPESPVTEGSEKMLSMFDTKNNNGVLGYKLANEKNRLSNEKVQIHSPPPENSTEEGPRSLHQIEELEEPINSPHLHEDTILSLAYKSNTGLSQSDLSITSSNDSNKGYCYGNQALYIVEQCGYSTMSPIANVVLKCDAKAIKDEDHNPENDHYLEHSPNKKEDEKDKEDVVGSVEKQDDSGNKVSEEKTPRQRAGDREILHEEITKDNKEAQYLEREKGSDINMSQATEVGVQEIILTADLGSVKEAPVVDDSTGTLVEQPPPSECLTAKELHISKEIHLPNEFQIPKEPLLLQESSPIKNTALPIASTVLKETPLSIECPSPIDEPLAVKPVIPEETIFAAPDKFSDHIVLENRINTENHIESVENSIDYVTRENLYNSCITQNGGKTENIAHNDHSLSENDLIDTERITLQLKEQEISLDKPYLNGEILNIEIQVNSIKADFTESNDLKENSAQIDIKPLTNGSDTLPDLVTELKSSTLQNGHIDFEPPSNSLTEMENGYDSIMSLPEPPPTTDEQLNNDLSDQQLDSLPPPPPPEIFNLKDLPPPLTNGTDTDPLSSEESNNFYNTLPPPPPTTLDVSATNGKMHASPLTPPASPPASPPAHFTNNLHAGLCAQPIAVDVNGS